MTRVLALLLGAATVVAAVIESATPKARFELIGGAASPSRTRNALRRVLTPRKASTAAPSRPRIVSKGPIVSSGATPAAPSAA